MKIKMVLYIILIVSRALRLFTVSGAEPLLVNPDDWLVQCFGAFQENCCLDVDDPHIKYSNFYLIDKPSGLCSDHLTCAFEMCDPTGVEDVFLLGPVQNLTYNDVKDTLGSLNLPTEIAFPETVADIVQAIQRAKSQNLTVSIKSTGHSYAGSSTSKNSVQINLRSYPKYSRDGVIECSSVTAEDNNACQLAQGRGKTGIIKVGGGEVWSDVYLAVINANTSVKYDIVGGAAGSVGAAGGWLQGGGWSHGVERLYGLGVDQVLELEMVLSDERHIRFGPTKWETADGFLYPRTTSVEGLCNANTSITTEADWVWEECNEPVPPFADLWYAVRGGGGGTYGIVTALKYQLHEARPLQLVTPNATLIAALLETNNGFNLTITTSATRVFLYFLLELLYNPSKIGLDEATSNLCGSPSLYFNLFYSPLLFCYDNAWTTAVLPAWEKRVSEQPELAEISDIMNAVMVAYPVGSYPEAALLTTQTFHPEGRVPDNPLPSFVPDKGFGGWCSAIIPSIWLAEGGDDVFELLSQVGGEHTTGGNVAIAHDQMSAVTQVSRDSGLSSTSLDGLSASTQSALLSRFLGEIVTNKSAFPGVTEVNHVCPSSYGPLKTNMTVPCPSDYTVQQKEEECYSIQESIWGTEVLAKLENIKYAVDPSNLFDCYPCVKPRQAIGQPTSVPQSQPAPTEPPTEPPTGSSAATTSSRNTNRVAIAGLCVLGFVEFGI